MLECLQHKEFRDALISTDASLWLHGKQYTHWEMYRNEHTNTKGAVLSTGQESVGFVDAKDEDVKME